MISLGLLGKDIAHSKSEDLYKELLSQELDYKKYDIPVPEKIPTLNEIFEEVQGLSITSPYKKHFLDQVELDEEVRKLGGINCIRKLEDGFKGTNTDYLALLDILNEIKKQFSTIHLTILGDGTMAQVTVAVAEKIGISYEVMSRKKTPGFSKLHLEVNRSLGGKEYKNIIINACSRAFIFSGTFDSGIFFLDYNYNFEPHQNLFKSPEAQYVDGIDLLKRQAKYALKFWQISN